MAELHMSQSFGPQKVSQSVSSVAQSCLTLCVCVCMWLWWKRPTCEFLWRPMTLFPNNAWSWNRLFFHLPALCLACTPILLPQITCWCLMPGYLARVPFLSCPRMGVISSFVWPAVLGVGGRHRVTPNCSAVKLLHIINGNYFPAMELFDWLS